MSKLNIKAMGEVIEIDIYGEIVDSEIVDSETDMISGISPKLVSDALKEYPDAKQIVVNINSIGGSAFAGIAIYNILTANKDKKVTINIDGYAVSAASIVVMAGDIINIASNAMIMIHEPTIIIQGNKDELLKGAELLEKTELSLRDTYAARTGNTPEQITAWIEAETWFTATEAITNKFATAITPAKRVAACLDTNRIMNFKYKTIKTIQTVEIPELIEAKDTNALQNISQSVDSDTEVLEQLDKWLNKGK